MNNVDNTKGISEHLVDFLFNLDYSDLPSEVVHQAKRCLLDYLGVTLAGSATETADKLKYFLSNFKEEAQCTVIGYKRKTDIFKSAMLNGITSHVLELDDGHRYATVHTGAAVISSLLPLIEQRGNIDGKSAIVSLVVGYETALMLGKAVQPSHRSRGFHATATCGTIGAAMAASKALNLSKEDMSNALGLAGTSASGLLQFLEDGSEIKQYHPGKAALCGLLAAYLAQSGLTAPHNILEGGRGFFHSTTDNCKLSGISANLGKSYAILDVYFKPYAACRHCHAPIEAILNIRSRNNFDIDQINKIFVFTYRSAVDGHSDPLPKSIVGAKMSVPFSVAVTLKTGWAGPKQFEPSSFNDPEIVSIAKKVEVKEDPTFTQLVPLKRPAVVEITMLDGRKFQDRVDFPKGEPENPMSDENLRKKFTELTSSCRSTEEIKNIVKIVENTEKQIGEIYPNLY